MNASTFNTNAHARWEDRQLNDYLDSEDEPETPPYYFDHEVKRWRDADCGNFVTKEKAIQGNKQWRGW